MARAISFAVRHSIEKYRPCLERLAREDQAGPPVMQHGVNRPYADTGWRVGMPVGSNYPRTTPVQFNRLMARGVVRADGTQLVTFAQVRGYGILGE
jgi:hypothetical protein